MEHLESVFFCPMCGSKMTFDCIIEQREHDYVIQTNRYVCDTCDTVVTDDEGATTRTVETESPDRSTIKDFEKVLSSHIKKHQQLEIQADRDGYYITALNENCVVSALIDVRNECGL